MMPVVMKSKIEMIAIESIHLIRNVRIAGNIRLPDTVICSKPVAEAAKAAIMQLSIDTSIKIKL